MHVGARFPGVPGVFAQLATRLGFFIAVHVVNMVDGEYASLAVDDVAQFGKGAGRL